MTEKQFRKTPFYESVKFLIKDIGFDQFKKRYPGFVKSAELWLEIEKMKKAIDKLETQANDVIEDYQRHISLF